MGATRNTGYLENLIQYDASDNVAIATSVNPSYKVTLGGSMLGTSAVFSGLVTANANIRAAGIIYGRTTNNFPTTGAGYYAITTNNFDAERGGITIQVSSATNTLTTALSINYLGAATFSGQIIANNTSQLKFESNNETTNYAYANIQNTSGFLRFGVENSSGSGLFTGTSAYSSVIGSVTDRNFHIATNGSVKLTVTNGGNVGINVTPSAWGSTWKAIQINAQASIAAENDFLNLSVNAYNDGTNWKRLATGVATNYYQVSGVHVWRYVGSDSAGTNITWSEAMRITSGGNVGIGTTSINASSGYKMLRINGATTGGEIVLAGNEVEYGYMYASSGVFVIDALGNYPLRFRTNAGNRMDITGGGNVAITNNLAVGRAEENGVRLSITSPNTLSSNYNIISRDSSGNDLFVLRNDGYMLTGTRAFSPYNNTSGVAANMVVGADGTLYRSTSSLKYKTNVKSYNRGLNEVMQLNPVYYNSKNEKEQGIQFAGLIAEEVHDLGLTEFVQYAEDGSPDALAYQNMVALLTKAIQEQQAQIEELKSKLS